MYAKNFQRTDFMLHLYGRNIAWIEVKAIFTLYGNEASVIIVFDTDKKEKEKVYHHMVEELSSRR